MDDSGVALDAGAALGALAEPATDVRRGTSLVYLAEVAAFANELVERGRVLPTVERDGAGAVAVWRPVLTGPDVIAAHALTSAMPPVCRAVPGRDDPHDLVTEMVHRLVDAAMRQGLPADLRLVPPRRGRRPRQLPAVKAWLEALTSPDPRFDADDAEVDTLVAALQLWAEVGARPSGPARATFRLSDDATDADPGTSGAARDEASLWRLEFLLESTEDPSLLVPATQAWDDDGSLARWLEDPQELLLTELGRTSRIYPELSPGLRHARPEALELDAEGADHFLSKMAPALDEAGFGVLLPSWWDKRHRLSLKVIGIDTDRRCGRRYEQVRQGPADGFPLAARGRRRHPDRHRSHRPGGNQGSADSTARPVGGSRPRADQARAEVPGKRSERAEDRWRTDRHGRQPSR